MKIVFLRITIFSCCIRMLKSFFFHTAFLPQSFALWILQKLISQRLNHPHSDKIDCISYTSWLSWTAHNCRNSPRFLILKCYPYSGSLWSSSLKCIRVFDLYSLYYFTLSFSFPSWGLCLTFLYDVFFQHTHLTNLVFSLSKISLHCWWL